MTLNEYVISISPIPLGAGAVKALLLEVGLSGDESVSPELLKSSKGLTLKALILEQAVVSPSVTQSGISYSLTAEARQALRREAESLRAKAKELAMLEDGARMMSICLTAIKVMNYDVTKSRADAVVPHTRQLAGLH